MTSHDEILERMSGANPLPDVEMITDGQLAEMTLQLEEARRAGRIPDEPQELRPTRTRIRWMRPAVAFAAAVLVAFAVIGAVSLTTGGESDVAGQTSPTATTQTTSPSTTSTFELPPDEWNPVLATVAAGPAPAPATCPAGTDPTAPGSRDQDRPAVGSPGLLSAAFDRRAGRVIYVDGASATWAFDVCTNTWTNLRPSGAPTGNISGGLVYDIDSDVTVSIEADEIFVYDTTSNKWEVRANTSSSARGPVGAAYDPVSGLIITSSPAADGMDPDYWIVQAYDVDADEWHDLGVLSLERETPCCTGIDLLGYSAELDRLILTTYIEADEATLLLDPRTGEMTVHAIPTPVVNLAWPSHSYGRGDTVYVHAADQVVNGRWTDVLCGFDPTDIAWTRCFTAPEQFPAVKHDNFDAIVGDSINNRLLLIGSTYYASVPRGIDDVWAIDLETGEWIEILAESELVSRDSPPAEAWNPILADTIAGPTPPTAACPPSASPDEPGPIGQERPQRGFNGMLTAVFDRRLGRIIHVDAAQDTWAFDVCTNTWSNLNPSGKPPAESRAGLVYDADSDLTIALGSTIGVYDARANEWSTVNGLPEYPFGAVYDPVSGLVVTTQYVDDDAMALFAYDVDTDAWTLVGDLAQSGDLLGYSPELDRFIIATWDNRTLLLDPRSGEATIVATETPAVQFGWPKASYGTTSETAFVASGVKAAGGMIVDVFPGYICGFDPEKLTWSSCFANPGERYYPGFGAIVGDPINDRLLFINGVYGNFWVNATDHVWAIDLATGELSELLAPSE